MSAKNSTKNKTSHKNAKNVVEKSSKKQRPVQHNQQPTQPSPNVANKTDTSQKKTGKSNKQQGNEKSIKRNENHHHQQQQQQNSMKKCKDEFSSGKANKNKDKSDKNKDKTKTESLKKKRSDKQKNKGTVKQPADELVEMAQTTNLVPASIKHPETEGKSSKKMEKSIKAKTIKSENTQTVEKMEEPSSHYSDAVQDDETVAMKHTPLREKEPTTTTEPPTTTIKSGKKSQVEKEESNQIENSETKQQQEDESRIASKNESSSDEENEDAEDDHDESSSEDVDLGHSDSQNEYSNENDNNKNLETTTATTTTTSTMAKKTESEYLESTKPTINQQTTGSSKKGHHTTAAAGTGERITKAEFESLNDEINELNSGVNTLKHSYGSIIKSLIAMQNKRIMKRKMAKQQQQPTSAPITDVKKINFLTTLSTIDENEMTKAAKEMSTSNEDKYNIEHFLNPITRESTFQMLFNEVEDLNKRTEHLRTNFYDRRGNFLRTKYDQSDYHLDRKKFNHFKQWTKNLLTIVNDLARNYNDDLLNMFRLV